MNLLVIYAIFILLSLLYLPYFFIKNKIIHRLYELLKNQITNKDSACLWLISILPASILALVVVHSHSKYLLSNISHTITPWLFAILLCIILVNGAYRNGKSRFFNRLLSITFIVSGVCLLIIENLDLIHLRMSYDYPGNTAFFFFVFIVNTLWIRVFLGLMPKYQVG